MAAKNTKRHKKEPTDLVAPFRAFRGDPSSFVGILSQRSRSDAFELPVEFITRKDQRRRAPVRTMMGVLGQVPLLEQTSRLDASVAAKS